MNIPRAEFGGRALTDPGLSKQLDVLTTENRALDERLIRERNEEIYLRAVRNFWLRTDGASR